MPRRKLTPDERLEREHATTQRYIERRTPEFIERELALHRAQQSRWAKENPEKVAAANRKWSAANREYHRQYDRDRYAADPEKYKARRRAHYAANRDAINARRRARRKAHGAEH